MSLMNELKQNFSKSWHDMQTTSAWVQTAQIHFDMFCSTLEILPWALGWNFSIEIPARRGRKQEQVCHASQSIVASTATICFATLLCLNFAKSEQINLSWDWGQSSCPMTHSYSFYWGEKHYWSQRIFQLQREERLPDISNYSKTNNKYPIIWIIKDYGWNQLICWIPAPGYPKET